jgi:hypothetical protein
MARATVAEKGISPVIMHVFPLAPVETYEKLKLSEQAEISACRHPDTKELYTPGVNIQHTLVSAATYRKGKGRGSLAKQRRIKMSREQARMHQVAGLMMWIALELREKGMTITMQELAARLNAAGLRRRDGKPFEGKRGMYRTVDYLYDWLDGVDKRMAQVVAEAFTKRDGTYAYV